MSIESGFPLESSPFVTTVAPELVFSAERLMQARLTALEEGLQPDSTARSQAAYVIVKALMEEPGEPMKVPDDPNDYIEDEVIVAVDLDEHLAVQESDPRKTLLITRFLEPLIEWEITNVAGERVAATLPAEWSDIEAAYKRVNYGENQTQIGLQQERVEASSAAGVHINRFAATLRAIPAFNKAVVDYMAPEPYLLMTTDPDVEERYLGQFWLGLAARPRLPGVPVNPSLPQHEMVTERKDFLVFPIGDHLVEVTYRRVPLHIAAFDADILCNANQLEITLLPPPEQDSPICKVILSTDVNSADCGIRYTEYDQTGNEAKKLTISPSQKAEPTYDSTEDAITKLRWAIARKAKDAC